MDRLSYGKKSNLVAMMNVECRVLNDFPDFALKHSVFKFSYYSKYFSACLVSAPFDMISVI